MKPNEVNERSQLAAYIRELADDAGRGKFENSKLESFLEALAAWTDDMDGYFENLGLDTPKQPDWALVANMLQAATMYE